jgi:hypothetical protein
MTKEQTNQLKLVSLIGELMGALSGSNFWINEESVKKSNIELVDRARKITNDVIDGVVEMSDVLIYNSNVNSNRRTYNINDPIIQKALKDFENKKITKGVLPDMEFPENTKIMNWS